MRRLNELKDLGYFILFGIFRKLVIGKVFLVEFKKRLEGIIVIIVFGIRDGVDIVRVYDVYENLMVVRMIDVIYRK